MHHVKGVLTYHLQAGYWIYSGGMDRSAPTLFFRSVFIRHLLCATQKMFRVTALGRLRYIEGGHEQNQLRRSSSGQFPFRHLLCTIREVSLFLPHQATITHHTRRQYHGT